MLEFLRNRVQKIEKEIQDLYVQRGKAGLEAVGSIENRLQSAKLELKKLNEELLDEEKKYKTPSQLDIFCCIIVSTKKTVNANLGTTCACNLEEDRYDEKEPSKWKPFNDLSIKQIISEFGEAYPFTEKYLDGLITDAEIVWIEDNIPNIIAIIDLLSLDDYNQNTATCFDSKESNVLLPLCRYLHPDVYEYADKKKSIFSRLNARANQLLPCNLFPGISGPQDFKIRLTHLFSNKFKITNRSTSENPVRGLNMQIQ